MCDTICNREGCDKPKARNSKQALPYCDKHQREYQRQWQRDNRDKMRASERRYRTKYPEKNKAKQKTYREADLGRNRRWKRESYERHKDERVKRSVEYKRVRRATAHECTEEQWQARLAFYGYRCYLCGCDWNALDPFDRCIDHVIPLAAGGTSQPANLRPACRSCNSKKWTRPLTDVLTA